MSDDQENNPYSNPLPPPPSGSGKANPRKFRPAGGPPPTETPAEKPAKEQQQPSQQATRKKAQTGTSRPVKRKPRANPAQDTVREKGSGQQISKEDNKALGAVIMRNEFYQEGYHNLMKIAIFEGIVILGLVMLSFFVVHTHQPENRYFATTSDGRLVPMVPLSQPNLSNPALMSWVAQAATEVMTFGFHDYRRRLQEASRNFTRKGWESFTAALDRSRILEMIDEHDQVVTAAPQGAPVLEAEGMVNGRYQWLVQIPLVLTYQSGGRTRTDYQIVRVLVVRMPRLESPNGVGIEQWIAVSGGG